MVYVTAADLPIQSPLSASSTGIASRVLLEDLSGRRALLDLRGDAAPALRRVFGTVPAAPGGVLVDQTRTVACLRPDHLIAATGHGDAAALAADLRGGGRDHPITLTDNTHGRGVLRLSGPRAADVLPKLCGLDFRERAFPDLHAAQTSYAKVKALLIRQDVGGYPAYLIVIDRSHAQYVWDVTADAMGEFLTQTE
jgi:heterotetrameric sarcosine oxidase gamma subunit